MVQFKECILVAVTHPLELRFRTSTKELKARSRVGKQAHSQSSSHGPQFDCCASLGSFLEAASH